MAIFDDSTSFHITFHVLVTMARCSWLQEDLRLLSSKLIPAQLVDPAIVGSFHLTQPLLLISKTVPNHCHHLHRKLETPLFRSLQQGVSDC